MGFLTAGVFDADKAKTAIAALAADKPAWTTTVNKLNEIINLAANENLSLSSFQASSISVLKMVSLITW